MSYGSTVLTQCETLQDSLDSNFTTCSASELRESTPFLDFLLSPLNANNITQSVVQGSKIRSVNLTYFQRLNESEVGSGLSNPNCSASTKRGNCVENYTLDDTDNLQVEEQITASDLNTVCLDDGMYLTGVVQRLIDVLARRVATKTWTEVNTETGAWDSEVSGLVGDILNVKTLKDSSVDVFPWTMQEIDTATMQSGYCGPTMCFSDVALWQYYDRVLAGCCADQGVDIGAIASEFGKVVQYDRRAATHFGANKALVTQPGALSLLQYAQNEFFDQAGVRRWIAGGSAFRHMVIFDPKSGLKMDLNITEQTCGTIDIVLTATTSLVSLPADIFGTGDSKDGVKYANEIEVVNV